MTDFPSSKMTRKNIFSEGFPNRQLNKFWTGTFSFKTR